MGIKIKRNNTPHQVIELNATQLFLVANGYLDEVTVDKGEYLSEGTVYLYQIPTDQLTEEAQKNIRDIYEEVVTNLKNWTTTFEDLLDFDDIIFARAEYKLVETGKATTMKISKIIPLECDEYLTLDENGDVVPLED